MEPGFSTANFRTAPTPPGTCPEGGLAAPLPRRDEGQHGERQPARPVARELVRCRSRQHRDLADRDPADILGNRLHDAPARVHEGADAGGGRAQEPAAVLDGADRRQR